MIETRRTSLLEPQYVSAEMVAEYFCRNQGFLSPWEPQRKLDLTKPDDCDEYLRSQIDEQNKGNGMFFWMIPKQSQNIIGRVNFSQIVRGNFLSCYMGYALSTDAQGQGLMKEGAGSAIKHMFRSERLHRIEANVVPWNERSLRLLKSLNFAKEGYSPKYLKIGGEWCDHVRMALLNDEM